MISQDLINFQSLTDLDALFGFQNVSLSGCPGRNALIFQEFTSQKAGEISSAVIYFIINKQGFSTVKYYLPEFHQFLGN